MLPGGNLLSGSVAALAVVFAIFQAQPSPPQSPLLYQWETIDGKKTLFDNKYNIFYKDIRGQTNNSETLLVLHGFPTSSFDFYLMVNGLRKTFERVILFDFLGFGYSDKPRDHPYSIAEQTNIAEHVLSVLDVKEFHILAHDYGDTIAQEFLARDLDDDSSNSRRFRVKSAALLNGGLFPSTHRPLWPQRLLRIPLVAPIVTRFANRWLFGNSLNQVFGENQLNFEEIKQLWFLARYNDGYRAWPNLLSYIDERQTFETRWTNALQRAKIPLCVFYGPADPVNPAPHFVSHYSKIIPRPCIETFPDRVGHYPQLEDPEDLMRRYVRFLKDRVKVQINEDQIKVVVPDKIPVPHPITE